jgi:predicted DNA binding CopG/RHH family protein
MPYDKDEWELLENIESGAVESMSFDNESIEQHAAKTLEYLSQKKQISINMKQSDLDFLKQRANDIGMSCQNIIQALVHNYTIGKIELKI